MEWCPKGAPREIVQEEPEPPIAKSDILSMMAQSAAEVGVVDMGLNFLPIIGEDGVPSYRTVFNPAIWMLA